MIRTLAGLCCSITLAAAAPASPGEAALDFLEKLGEAKLDLDADTALSPGTTREKTATIRQRLEALGQRLNQGNFEVLAEKSDDQLAAALLSQVVDFDPAKTQVHAVALVRRGEAWLPAPVPASFENTGITYHPTLGPAARRLEAWMLTQRPQQLDQLRNGLDAKLLNLTRQSLDHDTLSQASAFEAVQLFLNALRARDLPATFALLGGLENPPPEGWRESVTRIAAGFRTPPDNANPWTTLLNPHLVHAPVHLESQPATVAFFGFFDPTTPRPHRRDIQIRHFHLLRLPSGLWRLSLPGWLDGDDASPPSTQSTDSLREAFPLALIRASNPRGFPSPGDLGTHLVQTLASKRFDSLPGLLDANDAKADPTHALFSLSRLWNASRSSRHLRLLLESHRVDDHACGLILELDPYQPDFHPDLVRIVLMHRSPLGWQLAPRPTPAASELPAPLQPWLHQALDRNRSEWLASLGLGNRPGGLPATPAPAETPARQTAQAWINALAARDPHRAILHATLFDDESSVRRLFSFIGQEFATASQRQILAIHRHGRWAAASIRHQIPDSNDPPTDLLHPIITTSAGPRILPEAILYIPDSRARTFLNNEVWKRLGKRLPKDALDELRTLLDTHTALARPAPETDH